MYYKILSLDGGGIRGLITALVLKHIEEKVGKPISQLFDLIAGSSTGAIIALLLATPNKKLDNLYSANDVVEFYTKSDAKTIFSPYLIRLLHTEKFPSERINSVLTNRFKDVTLREVLTDVLITSYDLESRRATLFSNKNSDHKDLLLKDITRASSAAPTYFAPHNFNRYACIDGGIFANNPSMCAYVESIKRGIKDPVIVSIGTGTLTLPIHYKEAKSWNIIELIPPLIDSIFDGINDTTEYNLSYLLPKDSYFRFQATLPHESMNIDDVSEKNLNRLIEITNHYIENVWANDLDKVIDILGR